jgi:replicative DNA helicase
MASQQPTDRNRRPNSRSRTPPKETSSIERQPPFNLEAETGVLGSLMIMPDACDDIVNIIRAEDFYDEAHQKLFQHIMDMNNGSFSNI